MSSEYQELQRIREMNNQSALERLTEERDALAARLDGLLKARGPWHLRALKAEAERDALTATLAAIRKWVTTEPFEVSDKQSGYAALGPGSRVEAQGVYVTGYEDAVKHVAAILGSAPADHLNTVKADVWDECYSTAYSDTGHILRDPNNPYRTEQGEQSNG